MGLFDDLLKKPPQPSGDTSGGASSGSISGQQGDILASTEAPPVIKIEKTTEQAILTDSVTPSASSQPQVDQTQVMPSITVDTNASGIIVNGEAVTITPIVTPPEIQTISTPIMVTTPVIQEAPAPIVAESATPLIVPEPQTIPSTDVLVETTSTSPQNTEVDLGNLFGKGEENMDDEAAGLVIPTIGESQSTTTDNNNSIMSIIPTGEEDSKEESETGKPELPSLSDHIQSNIDQYSAFIERINVAHEAKLTEASGYESEEKRFADLKTTAYQDAEKMVAERLHAEKMKEYFVKQLQEEESSITRIEAISSENSTEDLAVATTPTEEYFYDEPPMEEDITLVEDVGIDGSVNTALTGIAVQNTVKNTVEKKHKATKKHDEKKEESLSLV